MNKQARIASFSLFAIALIAGAGCEKQNANAPKNSGADTSPQAAVPAGFVLSSAPADAKDLTAAKADLTAGEEVVVRAIVGGSEHPFVKNRAVVQVIDPSVTTCDRMPGDSCKTPWDACCDQGNVKTKSATVQVVDGSGNPTSGTLEGVGGLKPLSEIVVKGKARMEGPAMVIDATALYVKQN